VGQFGYPFTKIFQFFYYSPNTSFYYQGSVYVLPFSLGIYNTSLNFWANDMGQTIGEYFGCKFLGAYWVHVAPTLLLKLNFYSCLCSSTIWILAFTKAYVIPIVIHID
jgi:hypothetical protein